MLLIDFSSRGWESWGLERQPLIREGMPVLVDDDLRFEDGPGDPRAAVVVNRWLRELPVSNAPARRTWKIYAQALRGWLEFLSERGVAPFGSGQELRSVLSAYAGHRLSDSPRHRWDGSTWNLHVTALSLFYEWAQAEGYASAGPFSYSTGKRIAGGAVWPVRRNHAKLRPAKRHAQIKYLEHDFAAVFLNALAGLTPDGGADDCVSGSGAGPQRRDGQAGAGQRAAPAGVDPPAGLRGAAVAGPAFCGPGAVPAGPGHDQGQQAAHDLARLRHAGRGLELRPPGARGRGRPRRVAAPSQVGRAVAGARPGLGGRPPQRGAPLVAAR